MWRPDSGNRSAPCCAHRACPHTAFKCRRQGRLAYALYSGYGGAPQQHGGTVIEVNSESLAEASANIIMWDGEFGMMTTKGRPHTSAISAKHLKLSLSEVDGGEKVWGLLRSDPLLEHRCARCCPAFPDATNMHTVKPCAKASKASLENCAV